MLAQHFTGHSFARDFPLFKMTIINCVTAAGWAALFQNGIVDPLFLAGFQCEFCAMHKWGCHIFARITSYNVCYTKLLRTSDWGASLFIDAERAFSLVAGG